MNRHFNRRGCFYTLVFGIAIFIFIILAILSQSSTNAGIWAGAAFVTVLCAIAVLPNIISRSNLMNLQKNAEEMSASVKVMSKTSEVSKELGRGLPINTFYYISFLFSDGSRKNFNVNINTYNTIMENDTGILTYKQNGNVLFFIDFQHQV